MLQHYYYQALQQSRTRYFSLANHSKFEPSHLDSGWFYIVSYSTSCSYVHASRSILKTARYPLTNDLENEHTIQTPLVPPFVMASQSNIERLFRLRKPLVKRSKDDKQEGGRRLSDALPPTGLSPLPSAVKRTPLRKESPRLVQPKKSPKLITPRESPRLAKLKKSRRLEGPKKSPNFLVTKKSPRLKKLAKDSPTLVTHTRPQRKSLKKKIFNAELPEGPHTPSEPPVKDEVQTPGHSSPSLPTPPSSIEVRLPLKRSRINQTPTAKTPQTPVGTKQSPYGQYTSPVTSAIPLPVLFEEEDDDDDVCQIRNDRLITPRSDPMLNCIVDLFVEDPHQ